MAWGEQLLVIASDIATFESGSLIQGDQILRLEVGESLTLVANDGRTFRLTGPYDGPAIENPAAGAGESALLETLSKLVTGTGGGLRTLAVARGSGVRKAVWTIPVHSPERVCTAPDTDPLFSRKRKSLNGELTLSQQRPRMKLTFAWPAGKSKLAWPNAMPLDYAAVYIAELRDARETTRVTIHALPNNLPSDAHRVAWMAERGCTRQARLLLQIIAREASG